MPEPQADLVIQISASEACADSVLGGESGNRSLASELRQRLEPGREITLKFPGYLATTSIVWISDSPCHCTFHAGVRLLAVSNDSEEGILH
jgi:hypothetical protein